MSGISGTVTVAATLKAQTPGDALSRTISDQINGTATRPVRAMIPYLNARSTLKVSGSMTIPPAYLPTFCSALCCNAHCSLFALRTYLRGSKHNMMGR
jgi:hypothetical protein